MHRTSKASAVAVALLGAVSSAFASELVFNGGFETGSFSGWSVPPNVGFPNPNPQYFEVVPFGGAHSGTFYAVMASTQLRFISQVLPTQAG